MITKWATSIANKLAELSGEDVSADQLEIYIYGLECFLNTFITIVLLFVWGVLSHTLGYTLIWVITCILFAPISNHKICLTTKQKWIHKLISVIIVSIGFLLFYKIGNTKMNTTLFYSFFCVIILMIVETIKNLMRHFK